ncbi:MAG TPA: CoA pyrophosphatase [Candidatus Cybelea sp.]|nr:CoA pyrophosphatase [Candidatus Cybelea sp.]
MQRSEVIERLGNSVPGRRSAPGTTPPAEVTLTRAFDARAKGQRGDHDLNPGMVPDRALTAAAVLVPLIDRDGGMTVLLTKRTEHLNDHAGQVSFPGGRIDPEDRDAAAAALREAKEEVGLDPDRVDLVGRLDTYVTRTGFEVTPFVGVVMPPIALVPDPFEVADVFEVPLAFFLDPASRKTESRVWQGKERFFYVYPWHGYYIWGATAGMLSNLAEVLRADAAAR